MTAEQANRVLRPLHNVATDTTAETVVPALTELKDPFLLRLQRALEQANEILDGILSDGNKPIITRVDLQLHNRELATEADVEALVNEIKARLLEQIRAGARVRLQ